MKIAYNVYLKNKDRKSATWTARIRQDGRTKDINLRTQDRAVAERWLRGAKRALEEYNDAEAEGKTTEELLGRVIRIDDVAVQRKAQGNPVSVREALEKYEVELRRRNYRESTIGGYMATLKRLYVQADPVDTVADIDGALRQFDGKSSGARHYYTAIVRGFVGFCAKKYGVRPSDDIPGVKVEALKTQPHWTVWQMRKIIEHAYVMRRGTRGVVDEEKTEWIRIYFWLLATSGLRQGEAHSIRWGDIDWANAQLNLRETETKARKARKAPIQSYVLELLAGKFRRGRYASTDPVFAGKVSGLQVVRYEILRRAIARANRELPVHSQIPMGSLHTFRHSVAMILYSPDENGVRPDLKAVANILGHSEHVALKYYQGTRPAEEQTDLLNSKFDIGEMRGAVDDMVEEGLI